MAQPQTRRVTLRPDGQEHPVGYPSLDLLYHEIREQLVRQLTDIDSLNSKASIIVGFDGVIIAALIQSLGKLADLRSVTPNVLQQWVLFVLLFEALLFLLASSILGLFAYWVRKYKGVVEPRGAYNDLLMKDQQQAKLEFVHTWIDSYERNLKAIDRKALLIKVSLISLILAVSYVSLFTCLLVLFSK